MKTRFLAISAFIAAATPALAQPNLIHNGSFEELDPFFGGPQGWVDFTNPGERYRTIGDGLGPILVRTGSASIELASGNNFAGFTSDQSDDCIGRRNNPRLGFVDDGTGHLTGPDIVVSGWYAIPSDQPLVGTNSTIKLEFRRANNSVFHAYENLSINGTTNGQWVKYTTTVTAADLDIWYTQFPPGPVAVSVLPIRFGLPSSTGTIFWDDITVTQGCPADINKDGFVDAIDYDLFISAFVIASPDADYNLDCFPDAIDYDLFITDWLAGGC